MLLGSIVLKWSLRAIYRTPYFGKVRREKVDGLKKLQAERSKLTAEQDRLYDERDTIKKQPKEVETVKGNVDRILKTEGRESERAVII